MMEKIRHQTLIAMLLFIGLLTLGSVSLAQDGRASGDFIYITGVHPDSDCDDIGINFIYMNTQPGYLAVRVEALGQIVTDDQISLAASGSYVVINTGYKNDRGLAPANLWPLTPGNKVKVYLTLVDLNFAPVYEARATMKSCAATTLKAKHGPAYQLLHNSSFENSGRDSNYVSIPEEAAFWKGTNTVNDARVCDPAPRVRAGSSVYVGECGFLFNADGVTKSKLVQDYIGTIGEAGDTIMLQGFVQSFGGYAGDGKFIALLRFADGTTRTIKRNFRVGQWLYNHPNGFPYFVTTAMPAPLISAKVTIKQGFGAAQAAVDAVTLTVFSKNGGALRAVPPAPDQAPVYLAGDN
jgi:hypothetical protein